MTALCKSKSISCKTRTAFSIWHHFNVTFLSVLLPCIVMLLALNLRLQSGFCELQNAALMFCSSLCLSSVRGTVLRMSKAVWTTNSLFVVHLLDSVQMQLSWSLLMHICGKVALIQLWQQQCVLVNRCQVFKSFTCQADLSSNKTKSAFAVALLGCIPDAGFCIAEAKSITACRLSLFVCALPTPDAKH